MTPGVITVLVERSPASMAAAMNGKHVMFVSTFGGHAVLGGGT